MDDRESYEARYLLDGRRVQISDLLAARLLNPGEMLMWELKRKGAVHTARVEPDGTLRLGDGRTFRTPSRTAAVVAGVRAVDGWHAWAVRETGETLDQLRGELLDREVSEDTQLAKASRSAALPRSAQTASIPTANSACATTTNPTASASGATTPAPATSCSSAN